MDIKDVEPWYMDIVRTAHEIKYGTITFQAQVSNGEISKVIANRSNQVRFHSHDQDQKASKLWALDVINTLDGDGTTTFSVIHKGSVVSQINTFDTVEYKYSPGTRK